MKIACLLKTETVWYLQDSASLKSHPLGPLSQKKRDFFQLGFPSLVHPDGDLQTKYIYQVFGHVPLFFGREKG